MKVFAIMQGTLYFIVCSTEFVEADFKFFYHLLQTKNYKLKPLFGSQRLAVKRRPSSQDTAKHGIIKKIVCFSENYDKEVSS